MTSDPEVRAVVVATLMRRGSVYGDTFGEAVGQLAPLGTSMNKTKKAVNSLAFSTARSPQVHISRHGANRALIGPSNGYTIQLR